MSSYYDPNLQDPSDDDAFEDELYDLPSTANRPQYLRLGADALPPAVPEASETADPEESTKNTGYRSTTGDPTFGFLLALAISIGLTPMLPDLSDLRYTLAWGALAAVGVLGWLLGNAERIGQEQPDNVAWGVGFGLLLGAPFLLFGADILERATLLIFPGMTAGSLLAYLVFVMPLAETLFFRSMLQQQLEFYIVGLLATFWNIALFFPVMWGEILTAPAVSVIIVIALLMMNMLYSYVRERNGLAAAWITQIVAGLLMVFVPFL